MAQSKIDLRERTKSFALRVARMFSTLPKTTEAQILGKQVRAKFWQLRSSSFLRLRFIGAVVSKKPRDDYFVAEK